MVSTTQIIGQTAASAESGAADANPGPAKAVPDAVKAEAPGRPALDPTRYGDWEKNGRCIDF